MVGYGRWRAMVNGGMKSNKTIANCQAPGTINPQVFLLGSIGPER